MKSIAKIQRRSTDRRPNATTRAALKEDIRKGKRYKSIEQLLKALKQ